VTVTDGVVDLRLVYRILAMDDYAIKTLEAIDKQQKAQSVVSSALFPFSNNALTTRRKLIETFNQAAGILESNLRRLVSTLYPIISCTI
jgi:hypothetical protein